MSLKSGLTPPALDMLPRPIRVGIADDHSITRYAVRQFIDVQQDMVLADEASDARGAIDIARRMSVDVLLLDLTMQGAGGLDVLRLLRAKAPKMGVIVYTAHPPAQFAVSALRLGANAYVCKEDDPGELIDTVRAVGRGRLHVSPAVAQVLAESTMSAQRQAPHTMLSDREFQLLLHFARGSGSAQIAKDLSISPKTVSTHRTTILRKLGIRSSSEMTYYALVHRLID